MGLYSYTNGLILFLRRQTVGSPGFLKDEFFKYLLSECQRREDRILIENKNKFVMCHCNSGHKHEIEGLFSDPNILSRVTETKV